MTQGPINNKIPIHPKLLLTLTLAFMLATVVGTVSHELGHYTAARLLGYEASINYRSTLPDYSPDYNQIMDIRKKYGKEIKEGSDYPDKQLFSALNKKIFKANFWICLAGPLQTALTGTVGLLILLFYRKRFFNQGKVTAAAWCFVFMALFWLREPANFFTALVLELFNRPKAMFGDEFGLTYYLDWPLWSIITPAAIIGAGVLLLVLYVLPKQIRATFMLSGLLGSTLGFWLWFFVVGQGGDALSVL
jgi:hypothetical protein